MELHLLFFTTKVSTTSYILNMIISTVIHFLPIFEHFEASLLVVTTNPGLVFCFKLMSNSSNLGGILRESGVLKNYILISLVVFTFDQSRSSRDVLWYFTDSNFGKYFMKLLGFKVQIRFPKGFEHIAFFSMYLLTRWARWVSLQANLDT